MIRCGSSNSQDSSNSARGRKKEMEDGCPLQILTVMPFDRKME